MQRLVSVLLYSVLGLVLAASLGAAALAFSADPGQFAPSKLSVEQQLDQEAELPPMTAVGPDELRIWTISYGGWLPNSAGLHRIRQGHIESFTFQDGSWGRRWAIVGHVKADTLAADRILGLLSALHDQERSDDMCFDAASSKFSGRIRGKLFEVHSAGCVMPPVERQIWELINSVPEFAPQP